MAVWFVTILTESCMAPKKENISYISNLSIVLSIVLSCYRKSKFRNLSLNWTWSINWRRWKSSLDLKAWVTRSYPLEESLLIPLHLFLTNFGSLIIYQSPDASYEGHGRLTVFRNRNTWSQEALKITCFYGLYCLVRYKIQKSGGD